MAVSKHVADLKSRVGDLKRQVVEAEKRLHDARVEESGVAIGEVVSYKGLDHKVTGHEFRGDFSMWLYGARCKKDGTFGVVEQCLYSDWTKKTDA